MPDPVPDDAKANGKPTVFVSYSHHDEIWKDRLQPQLKVLQTAGRLTLWDDRKIDAGETWYDEIATAMAQATVAVMLISEHYLSSDFITKEEVPYLVKRREEDGAFLLPILIGPCSFKAHKWLSTIQMWPRDSKTVEFDYKGRWKIVFAQIADIILEKLDDPAFQPRYRRPLFRSFMSAGAEAFAPALALSSVKFAVPFVESAEVGFAAAELAAPEPRIDIARLPVTGAELFGRQNELAWLDAAWDKPETHVVSLVAWGGVGKSTLVNRWLEALKAEGWRGVRRVYGWSFYSQGTNDTVTSADPFIAEALAWFGDPDPAAGSPWAKGERLAELVRRERTLLVLDGMEPLQWGRQGERGRIKDPALAMLVTELARDNPGLCVITTREPVADLAPFAAAAARVDLEQISPEAGRALLRVAGVRGTDVELEQASRDFGNHALALRLLAAWLRGIPGHPVACAAEIPPRDDIPIEQGRHSRRVMAALAARFGDGPEVQVLRLLGLFDRPADAAALAALRQPPAIPELTDRLVPLSDGDWLRAIGRLRDAGLVAPASHHAPDDLDAHPLVREHFGEELRHHHPEAWRAGHSRLYEHLRDTTEYQPDTLTAMAPLFAAVAHGCAAGRHQEGLDEVYWRRICQGDEFYCIKKLGAFGADLAAMSGFFDPPWCTPVPGLTEADKHFVLSAAGFDLRALGRLAEAVEPMQAALDAAIRSEDWKNAAIQAGNLSQLLLVQGELAQAAEVARQSVGLADRSGDTFLRLASRTNLADVLHQAGDGAAAGALFAEAEKMQAEWRSDEKWLYSLGGFRYCDLLLAQEEQALPARRPMAALPDAVGRAPPAERPRFALPPAAQARTAEVKERAAYALAGAKKHNWLRDIALDHLSLGRAHLLEAEATGDFREAAGHLDQAVDGLRQAGTIDHVPRGLLARAALRRLTKDFPKAHRDLDEAMTIAGRGGMKLYEADCHLEYARLALAEGDTATARAHFAIACAEVERMGYHRRDPEIAALAAALG